MTIVTALHSVHSFPANITDRRGPPPRFSAVVGKQLNVNETLQLCTEATCTSTVAAFAVSFECPPSPSTTIVDALMFSCGVNS